LSQGGKFSITSSQAVHQSKEKGIPIQKNKTASGKMPDSLLSTVRAGYGLCGGCATATRQAGMRITS
jgi:hypothetical protein